MLHWRASSHIRCRRSHADADSIQIELGDTQDPAVPLARLHPLGPDHGDVKLVRLLPLHAPALGGDKVCGIDSNGVDQLGANPVYRTGQRLPERGREDARGDSDAAEVRHLVCADHDLVAG